MFKMSAFSVNTGQRMTSPLISGIIHSALFQSTPHVGDKTSVVVSKQ